MKDPEFVQKFFEIAKHWEKNKKTKFVGKTFNEIRKENYSNQDFFFLSPVWLNYILSECGKIPNKYSFETAIKRIKNLKQYSQIPIDKNKRLFNRLLKNKKLAAGAFVVSMDLEVRGLQGGRPSLCMSEKYKDFLEFMLKIAKKWEWTNNKKLCPVKVENSRKRGINASDQYEFRINIKGLQEIYNLAGPLINNHKDKCIKFHVNRSKKYINLGGKHKYNKSKEKILKYLEKNPNSTTTDLQFITHTGADVVLIHLKKLEELKKVIKERKGKKYIWRVK